MAPYYNNDVNQLTLILKSKCSSLSSWSFVAW